MWGDGTPYERRVAGDNCHIGSMIARMCMRNGRKGAKCQSARSSKLREAQNARTLVLRTGLSCQLTFSRDGHTSMLHENAEHHHVRDQQHRHDESRNEIRGPQLPR